MAASLIPLSALTTPPDSLLPDYLKRSPAPQAQKTPQEPLPSVPTPQLDPLASTMPGYPDPAASPTPANPSPLAGDTRWGAPQGDTRWTSPWMDQAPPGYTVADARNGTGQPYGSPWGAFWDAFTGHVNQPPPQSTIQNVTGAVGLGPGAMQAAGSVAKREAVPTPPVVPTPAPTAPTDTQATTPTPGLDAPDKEARKRLFGAIIGTYAGSLQDPNRASADIMLDRALGQLMANGFIPDGVAMGRLEVGGRGTLVAKDAQAQQALDAWRSKVREQFYGYLVGSQQDALRQEETKQQALIALNRAFGTSLTGQPMNGPVWAPGTEPQTYAPQVAGVDAARPGPPNPVALIQAYQAQQDETLRNAAALGAAPNASRGLGATQAALTPSQRNSRMAEIAKFREQVANSTGLTDADRRAAEEWATQQEQEALRGIMPPSPPLADGSIVVEMINPETGMRERGKIKPDEFDPNTMIRV